MILEEGEIITLNSNNKDYIVVKSIYNNNINYYYLMTVNKPTEVLLVKLITNQNGEPALENVVDKQELADVMKLTANI